MSITVTEEEVMRSLPALLEKLEEVDEIIIEREGQLLARLMKTEPQKKNRIPGLGAGKGEILPSFFDSMTDEELKEWGLI